MLIDQLSHPPAILLGRSAEPSLALCSLLVIMLGDQAAEIRGAQRCLSCPGRMRKELGRGRILAMEKALIDPRQRRREEPPAVAGVRYGIRRCRQRPHQVGAADDTDDESVTNHGDALDAVCGQQSGDIGKFGVLADRYDRARHSVARGEDGRLKTREEIGIDRFAFGKHRQPPVSPGLAILVAAPYEIALADHSYQ